MKTLWNALKNHPGVPIATFFTIVGFVAGAQDGNADTWLLHGAICAAIMSTFWIPVLVTAWQDSLRIR